MIMSKSLVCLLPIALIVILETQSQVHTEERIDLKFTDSEFDSAINYMRLAIEAISESFPSQVGRHSRISNGECGLNQW